jgi:tripartite-type tricarboxylate transporter receptor subunit TctC
MKLARVFCSSLLVCVATLCSAAVHAQSWPERPVRIIVPFPPGGVPDVLARQIGERLKGVFGQSFIVENRGGAGGNIGTEAAAKAAPDGYTLLVGSSGPIAINPTLYKSLPFDPVNDFEAVTLLAIVPNVLVVTNSFPAKSVAELIEYARRNPGKINYGSIGNGSSQHLAGTQFEVATGVALTHVPYKSVPQVVTDLMSGQIECMFQLVPNIARQVRNGQVRAVAVTTAFRSRALPDVPTMAEAGVANYDTAGWFGLLAPRGTPRPIVDRLDSEIRAILARPDVRAWLTEYGVEPNTMDSKEFARFIKAEAGRWPPIVKSSGAQID